MRIDPLKAVAATLIKTVLRPTVTGLENVPKEGGFVVASNHLSFFDSVIIQALMPRLRPRDVFDSVALELRQ